jgi:tripartite-type tricarboxylate transporter receptor subunit TctC
VLAKEDWPTRPINMIISYAAGGGTDLSARALKSYMEERLKATIVPVNVVGAMGAIAAKQVMDSPKDGYTWLFTAECISHFPAVETSGNISYKDFEIIGIATGGVPTFSVAMDSPIKDGNDFVARLKKGDMTASTSGAICPWGLGLAVLNDTVGGKVKYVPFGGGYPAAVAAMKKESDVGCSDVGEITVLLRGKQLRAITYMKKEDRHVEGYGTIPSILRFVPEIEPKLDKLGAGTMGRVLVLPKGTPPEIVSKVIDAFDYAVNQRGFKDFCDGRGFIISGVSGKKAEQVIINATSINSWTLYNLGMAKRSPAELGIPKP